MSPQVKPLSYRHRYWFFYLLMGVFASSLPFLYLYATGYRFEWGGGSLVSTGGLYIAAERTGAEIYIDDELVRETRVFRRAFYAQGLNAGTHLVSVQKTGHHTWVKELPVYAHLVTEAQAFNFPNVPKVRVITRWQTPAGVAVLTASSSVLSNASSTNQVLFEPRASAADMEENKEFQDLMVVFQQNQAGSAKAAASKNIASTTTTIATTTKESRGVRLYEDEEGRIFATYVGSRDSMPYYYCAEAFPGYSGATSTVSIADNRASVALSLDDQEFPELQVQTLNDETACDPTIEMDKGGEEVEYFDFFPGSDDLVILGSKHGIYVTEIDDRSWQNRQPLVLGKNMSALVVNGAVYAYDGEVFYQVSIQQSWF
jgi:hypothetical protein